MIGAAGPVTGLGRPNVFEVDLGAIAANVRAIRRVVGPAWLCPALKADAYGFGLLEVAHTALEAGADALAVGDAGEAVRLRRAGITAPLLVYAGSAAGPENIPACREQRLIATIYDEVSLAACLAGGGQPLEVFVEVDAGLQRLGVAPAELPAVVARIEAEPSLRLAGVYTHLHVPEAPDAAARELPEQFSRFLQAVAAAAFAGRRMAASSRVLARFPEMVLDAVDPGRAVYGLPWRGDDRLRAQLRPAFASLRSRLLQVKAAGEGSYAPPATRLGVIPLGRRDGLPLLSCGEVLVRGRRVPLLGPPSLEHSRLLLDSVPDAEAGDEVVVIGRQGGEEINVEEVLAAQPALASTAVALQVGRSVDRRHLG